MNRNVFFSLCSFVFFWRSFPTWMQRTCFHLFFHFVCISTLVLRSSQKMRAGCILEPSLGLSKCSVPQTLLFSACINFFSLDLVAAVIACTFLPWAGNHSRNKNIKSAAQAQSYCGVHNVRHSVGHVELYTYTRCLSRCSVQPIHLHLARHTKFSNILFRDTYVLHGMIKGNCHAENQQICLENQFQRWMFMHNSRNLFRLYVNDSG